MRMYPLFISTFITMVTLLLDIRGKCIKPAYKYIAIFFLVAGVQYTFNAYAEYDLFKETYLSKDPISSQAIFVIKEEKKTVKTPKELKKDYMFKCKQMMDYHYEEGCACLKEAEEASFLLPNLSEIDKANFCYTNLIATLSPGTPKFKVISVILAMAAQYGYLLMTEWQRVNTKLHACKYHFEMEEHYRLVGKFVQDELNSEKKNKK